MLLDDIRSIYHGELRLSLSLSAKPKPKGGDSGSAKVLLPSQT